LLFDKTHRSELNFWLIKSYFITIVQCASLGDVGLKKSAI